ncbi:MAG: FixH family protein [Alphaproteobacteria bacterium]|nr:FixH family protein [Alphaproteobacteria bacterium]
MRAAALAVALLAAGHAPTAAGAACGDDLGVAGVRRIERPAHVLAYRPEPATVEPGALFALRVAVCGRGAPAPDLVRVDAWMPEHGHGMNYGPVVTAERDGRWRVDGLMFHMPGRWEIRFDVGTRQRTERLAAEETVE